ncbi:MAG: SUF system Fe-S cluster assembly regulator [Gammaproteobacteria bacterium]|nr:SUF system Fe-S cluster assembly regulator [Gammaproteobacteria bacterium]
MLRISRLTDYGTMILVHLARRSGQVCSASDVAAGTHVALPTVQKILKYLARAELVVSVRGAEGGYTLGREPGTISAADILDALEGPVAITECSQIDSQCELESLCPVGSAWQQINKSIRLALDDIKLTDLRGPATEIPVAALTRSIGRPLARQPRS